MIKSLFDLFTTDDAYEQSDYAPDVADLILRLNSDELAVFPAAFAKASSAISPDTQRWRGAMEAALQFDIYETADDAIRDLRAHHDPRQAATVSSLLSSPAIGEEARFELDAMVSQISLPNLRHQVNIRLGNSEEPSGTLDHLLQLRVWPGSVTHPTNDHLTPIIYVSEVEAPVDQFWWVCAALVSGGAKIRRVSQSLRSLNDHRWAAAYLPVVCWTDTASAHWRRLTGFDDSLTVRGTGDLSQPVSMSRLLQQVDQVLPNTQKLAIPDDNARIANRTVFSPDTVYEGAFDVAEVRYLSGVTRSGLYRLSQNALKPVGGSQNHWNFGQLVTFRLLQAFRAQSKAFRAPPAVIVKRLEEIALENRVSQVAIDVRGKIHVNTGSGFEGLESGQRGIKDALIIDEAFKPFEIGGGLTIPNLLYPSRLTQVDPVILAGTPVVSNRRISVRSLAIAASAPTSVLRSAYPELTPAEISDATAVGNQILALKE